MKSLSLSALLVIFISFTKHIQCAPAGNKNSNAFNYNFVFVFYKFIKWNQKKNWLRPSSLKIYLMRLWVKVEILWLEMWFENYLDCNLICGLLWKTNLSFWGSKTSKKHRRRNAFYRKSKSIGLESCHKTLEEKKTSYIFVYKVYVISRTTTYSKLKFKMYQKYIILFEFKVK